MLAEGSTHTILPAGFSYTQQVALIHNGTTDTNTDTANLLTIAWRGYFWL